MQFTIQLNILQKNKIHESVNHLMYIFLFIPIKEKYAQDRVLLYRKFKAVFFSITDNPYGAIE